MICPRYAAARTSHKLFTKQAQCTNINILFSKAQRANVVCIQAGKPLNEMPNKVMYKETQAIKNFIYANYKLFAKL